MKKEQLSQKVSLYNSMIGTLKVSPSFVDYLRSDLKELKEAWDTTHGAEVTNSIEKEVSNLEGKLKQYEKLINDVKSSKLDVTFENRTSYEYEETS